MVRAGARLPAPVARLALLAAILSAASACPPALAQSGQAGALRGSVYDKDFGSPLPAVRVSIVEALKTTLTSADGAFVFQGVPAGSYTVSLARDGYERQVLSGVVVTPGQMTDLRAELSSEVVDMEELVVTGADLLADSELGMLEIRAEATAVQDAVSSDMISKAGASDVAGALKLVVGTSVVGGKYATVRGLSDRYTGTTVNGIRIPSADPRRKAVQVDLFPTGTIENLTVTKTFTPDQLGDFTGGNVDITTRSVPEEPLLSASISTEYNSLVTGNDDILTYIGGGVDSWGVHSDARDLPGEADEPLPGLPRFSNTPDPNTIAASLQYDGLVRSFAPVMGVERSAPGPNYGFSIAGGNRFELEGGKVIGAIGSITYTRKFDGYQGATNNSAGVSDPNQGITVTSERTDSRGIDELLIGALASLKYLPNPDHNLSFDLIVNQAAEDEARLQIEESGYPNIEQNQSLHYTERTVGSIQLHGNHTFKEAATGGLLLDWTASSSFTDQEEPDVRFFRNTLDVGTMSGGMPANSTDAQNTRRIFRDIGEDTLQGAANVTLPFTQWSGAPGSIKSGLYLEETDREYEQASFTYSFPNQVGAFTNQAVRDNRSLATFSVTSTSQLWTDDFLDPGRIGLAENRCGATPPPCAAANQLLWVISALGNDVDYTGDQSIGALYAMADLPLATRVKLIAGARQESTDISITPVNDEFGTVEVIEIQPGGDRAIVTVPQEQAAAAIEESSLLPSVGVTFELRPQMSLRASWTRTIARPTFRELAPVATEEFIFGDEFIGNPDLTLSNIANYDVRWEWFRRPGEVFAASVFAKAIEDPIEMISFAAGGRSFIQPVNYEKGRVFGAELEARVPLNFMAGLMRDITVGVNVTLIDSEVDVPESEQESLASFGLDEPTRRLQGQPEYLFNASLIYDSDRLGASAGLFYSVVGETLVSGAARGISDGTPNIFEERFGTLDLTFSKKLGKKFSLGIKTKNVLHPDRGSVYRTSDGEEAVKTERETPSLYAVSVSWKW